MRKTISFLKTTKSLTAIILVIMMIVQLVTCTCVSASAEDSNITDDINLDIVTDVSTDNEEIIPGKTTSDDIIDENDNDGIIDCDQSMEILSEIPSKRSSDTKYFLLSNGNYYAAQYEIPVHFKDDLGNYVEYDNRLVAETESKNDIINLDGNKNDDPIYYVPKHSDKMIRLSSISKDNNMIEVLQNNYPITWGLVDVKEAKIKTKTNRNEFENKNDEYLCLSNIYSEAFYENVYDDVDLQYIVDTIGIKENIILKSRQAKNSFDFKYKTDNLTAFSVDKKTIEFRNTAGEIIYSINSPVMIDAAGNTSCDVAISIVEQKNNSVTVNLSVDNEWLSSKDRKYPITIDPYFNTNQSWDNVQSSYVAAGNPSLNFGLGYYNSGRVYTGYLASTVNGNTQGFVRTYVKLSSLPVLHDGDVVVGAYLNMLQEGNGMYASEEVYAYRVNGSWSYDTITWNNKPSYITRIVDSTTIDTNIGSSGYKWRSWDVTSCAKGWYNEDPNYGIILKSANETTTSQNVTYMSGSYTASSTVRPIFTIEYRNAIGIESYWTYHGSSAGVNGSCNVNDFTGNLVATENVLSETGTRMPISISMVYNSCLSGNNGSNVTNNATAGWQPDFNMSIVAETDSELKENGFDYYFADGDGTCHYMKKVTGNTYKDEDGLGLTLTAGTSEHTMTDKQGNTYKFYVSGGGIIKSITDSYGNTITYTSSVYSYNSRRYITSITDGANRTTNISYVIDSNNKKKISSITRPDNKTITFSYATSPSTLPLQQITYPDGQTVNYTYDSSIGKMNGIIKNSQSKISIIYNTKNKAHWIQEYSNNSTAGSYIRFVYNTNFTTQVVDNKQRFELISFDRLGRTIGIEDTEGNTISASYYSGNNATNNKLSLSSSSQAFERNYIRNPIIEYRPTGFSGHLWNGSSSGIMNETTDTSLVDGEKQQYLGIRSIIISHTDTDQFFTTKAQRIEATNLTDKRIVFSAYMKTSNIETVTASDANAGAHLRIVFFNSSNSSISTVCSEYITGTNLWRRISVSAQVPSNASYFLVHMGIRNAYGTAWFDALQVEQSDATNDCNLLVNSNLKTIDTDLKWTGYNTTSSDGITTNGYVITGNVNTQKGVYQDVAVNKKNVGFNLYARVSASARPFKDLGDSRGIRFDLRAKFYYEGTDTDDSTTKSFDPLLDTPQVVSFSAAPKLKNTVITKIRFFIRYYYNIGQLTLQQAMLTFDETGTAYTYDNNGNLETAKDSADRNKTYTYNTANEMTQYNNPKNEKYKYVYDSTNKHKLLRAYSDQMKNGFEYSYDNSTGNVTGTKLAAFNANGTVDTSKDFINTNTVYGYNYNYVTSTTGPIGNTTNYVVSSNSGLTTKMTDPLGTVTDYTYNPNNYYITSVATSGGGTSASVSYSYNSNFHLSAITQNNMSYNFQYDEWNNLKSVDAANYNNCKLVNNIYDSYGDTITRTTYGNNQANTYTYDLYDRVIEKTFVDANNTTQSIAEYKYNNTGLIGEIADKRNNYTKTYLYDVTGRPVSTGAKGGAINYVFTTKYDNMNNVTSYDNVVNGVHNVTTYEYTSDSLPSSTYNSERQRTYSYDYLGRLSSSASPAGARTYTYYKPYANTDTDATHKKWTSNLVETEAISNITYKYEYDLNGNITAIYQKKSSESSFTPIAAYAYDSLGRVSEEAMFYVDTDDEMIFNLYTYDSRGNVLKKHTTIIKTDFTLVLDTDADVYTYNSYWKDLISTYNGSSISYDNAGNPTTYRDGMTMTWKNGKELTTLQKGTTGVSYKYDDNSIRTKKTVNGVVHDYEYVDGKLMYEKSGSDKLYFSYDAFGNPYSIKRNSNYYYYDLNWRGDVIGLRSKNGSFLCGYKYDAWGKFLGAYNSSGSKITNTNDIALINPIRYRGYYYDTETGFYYLGSRYYDPQMYRFLNADTTDLLTASPMSLSDKNLFSYCDNNPIMFMDVEGKSITIACAIALATVLLSSVLIFDGVTAPLTEAEKDCVRQYPISSVKAFMCACEAKSATERIFGFSDDGTIGNAYQHAYWNALMTDSMGVEKAKMFADAHEKISNNPTKAMNMDLHNNKIGRLLGIVFKGQGKEALSYQVLQSINRNQLIILNK